MGCESAIFAFLINYSIKFLTFVQKTDTTGKCVFTLFSWCNEKKAPLVLVRAAFSVFAVNCFRLLRCVGPVSYTHLDVYKRQNQYKP